MPKVAPNNARSYLLQTKREEACMFAQSKISPIAVAVLASAANAQEKVWKHGILETKSDSGFIASVIDAGVRAGAAKLAGK
jgi:hypothetical protein